MNIFVLDADPFMAAKDLCNQHVVKMIVETAQLLSTAHRCLDGNDEGYLNDGRQEVLYKITHKNHPCAIWARENSYNYSWLYLHFLGLLNEYMLRYGKIHSCSKLKRTLLKFPNNIPPSERMTDFKLCMPEEYKVLDNPIKSYRIYYLNEKLKFARWPENRRPKWTKSFIS